MGYFDLGEIITMKCSNCGAELKPGARFCGKCAQEVVYPKKESSWRSSHTSSVNRMPQGIALGSEERIVRKYQIGKYTFRQGSIDVIITNKRVIRYEESTWLGMQNNQIDEIFIEAVHGTSTSMVRSISIMGGLFALVFIILGIILVASTDRNSYMYYYASSSTRSLLFGILSLCLGVFIAVKSIRPTLVFSLHGAIGGPALETVVNSRGRWFRRDNTSIVFQFKPTSETTTMLKEIGACVYDLKAQGDSAIEKWV